MLLFVWPLDFGRQTTALGALILYLHIGKIQNYSNPQKIYGTSATQVINLSLDPSQNHGNEN